MHRRVNIDNVMSKSTHSNINKLLIASPLILIGALNCVPNSEIRPVERIEGQPTKSAAPKTDAQAVSTATSASSDVEQTIKTPQLSGASDNQGNNPMPEQPGQGQIHSDTQNTAAGVATSDLPPPGAVRQYLVREGDSLSSIAACHGISLGSLLQVNSLSNPNFIFPGQRINLPIDAPEDACRDKNAYVVRKGDTLSKIASIYRVSVADLKEINALNSDLIQIGQRLKIPQRQSPKDRDQDGVPDGSDLCPDIHQGKTPDASRLGCPLPKVLDRDKDGVSDSEDQCPDLPRGSRPDPMRNGCPLPIITDRDSDGIPDKTDICPDTHMGPRPDTKRIGCPVIPETAKCETTLRAKDTGSPRRVFFVGGNAGDLFDKYLAELKARNYELNLRNLTIVLYEADSDKRELTAPTLNNADFFQALTQKSKWRMELKKISAAARLAPMDDAKLLAVDDVYCGERAVRSLH